MSPENVRRGCLITLEGIDGAGKSTQALALATLLETQGYAVVRTREPGATPFGAEVRRLLLETEIALTPEAELLLFLADRAEHVARVIRPALEAGRVVVCDRFSDSTVAYQGYGRQGDLARVRRWDGESRAGVRPDLTVLLDCPVTEGTRRRSRHADRYQALDGGFHERVRQGFLALAAEDPARVRLVDSARPLEAVRDDIARLTLAWLRSRQST